jgi:hypothetical protein
VSAADVALVDSAQHSAGIPLPARSRAPRC